MVNIPIHFCIHYHNEYTQTLEIKTSFSKTKCLRKIRNRKNFLNPHQNLTLADNRIIAGKHFFVGFKNFTQLRGRFFDVNPIDFSTRFYLMIFEDPSDGNIRLHEIRSNSISTAQKRDFRRGIHQRLPLQMQKHFPEIQFIAFLRLYKLRLFRCRLGKMLR